MAAPDAVGFFFANEGVVTVGDNDGGSAPTAVTLSVVKDVEVDATAEHVPLWGWMSTRRVAVARHSAKVGVKIGYMKWLPAASTFFGYIMDPTSGTLEYTDTNDVKLFDVTFKIKNQDDEELTGTVHDVYFPGLSVKGNEGQWMRMDLVGEGTHITWA